MDLVHLQQHFLRMGYVVSNRDDNRRCRHCTELTLVRARCPNTGMYSSGDEDETIATTANAGSNEIASSTTYLKGSSGTLQ